MRASNTSGPLPAAIGASVVVRVVSVAMAVSTSPNGNFRIRRSACSSSRGRRDGATTWRALEGDDVTDPQPQHRREPPCVTRRSAFRRSDDVGAERNLSRVPTSEYSGMAFDNARPHLGFLYGDVEHRTTRGEVPVGALVRARGALSRRGGRATGLGGNPRAGDLLG